MPSRRQTVRPTARAHAEVASHVVVVFGAGVFVMGLLCAVLRVERNAYRFAGITLAIVMLLERPQPAWLVAAHRFVKVSMGIAVGLVLTALWPERQPPAAANAASLRPSR